MSFTNGEYFMWEDTGKELTKELINFKFRVHKLLPSSLREQVFTELDVAVEEALTSAFNFGQLDAYNNMNDSYSEFAKTNPDD